MEQINIKDFGGELAIINKIIRPIKNHKKILLGPGDDAAVIANETDENFYSVVTSDMYTNGDHFSDKYFKPIQIGAKSMEASISDIAAMGGKPLYALVNISLKPQFKVMFVRSIFRGIYKSCDYHRVQLIGGDIVKSSSLFISVTVIGQVKKNVLKTRKGAQVGDIIKVTGSLGAAAAGYHLFKRKYLGHSTTKLHHLEPKARVDLVDKIAPYAHAMQDISDGIGSELHHICTHSNTGAFIYEEKIPIEKYTIHSARAMNMKEMDFALYGGEDYELIYTVDPADDDKTPGKAIGTITPPDEGLKVMAADNQTVYELQKGFQHF